MARSNLGMAPADSGSNYKFGDKMKRGNPPRSMFDLTHLSTMDIPNAGIMIPICQPIETVDGDSFDIEVTSLLRMLPQVVPLYSRMRMYIYAFWSRCSDLWENWETFAKKGLNGNKILKIPTLNRQNVSSGESYKTIKTGSLGDFIGLPIGLNIYDEATDDGYKDMINALPFMMYTRIWRDYFCNPNLFLSMEGYNEALFPDNDDKFRLGDDGKIISFKEKNKNFCWNLTRPDSTNVYGKYGVHFWTGASQEAEATENNQMTMGLFFQNWADDRFTDALPFPQRGNTPTLDAEMIINSIFSEIDGTDYINLKDRIRTESGHSFTTLKLRNLMMKGAAAEDYTGIDAGYMLGASTESGEVATIGTLGTSVQLNAKTDYNPLNPHEPTITGKDIATLLNARIREDIEAQTNITLNKIRDLTIEQTELEKAALTDGSYQQFMETFFGRTPKNSKNYHPVFIGGTYTDIHFSEVLQVGTNTEANPLGEYSGHGIGGMDKEYLGHIECDDYGYIMILACLAPDTYYYQGLHPMWTKSLQSELYLPERARMGMTPILNEEIYALDTMEKNKGLWGYNMPFDYMRYKANEIHGKIADSNSHNFNVYTQARKFSETPALNYKFDEMRSHPELTVDNQPDGAVRKDYLAAPTESMATAQFRIGIRAVRPLPYKAEPAEILN